MLTEIVECLFGAVVKGLRTLVPKLIKYQAKARNIFKKSNMSNI